jgi:hypothetical protein
MRVFFVLVATCVLCQAAVAQTPDCKSIRDPAARLACYDKSSATASPSAAAKPTQRPAPAPKLDKEYVDRIGAEDPIMNERIKGICRGC